MYTTYIYLLDASCFQRYIYSDSGSCHVRYSLVMIELRTQIEFLEMETQRLYRKEEEINEYATQNTDDMMHERVIQLRREFDALLIQQQGEMDRMIARHDFSINTTVSRTNRIINDAESVAVEVFLLNYRENSKQFPNPPLKKNS